MPTTTCHVLGSSPSHWCVSLHSCVPPHLTCASPSYSCASPCPTCALPSHLYTTPPHLCALPHQLRASLSHLYVMPFHSCASPSICARFMCFLDQGDTAECASNPPFLFFRFALRDIFKLRYNFWFGVRCSTHGPGQVRSRCFAHGSQQVHFRCSFDGSKKVSACLHIRDLRFTLSASADIAFCGENSSSGVSTPICSFIPCCCRRRHPSVLKMESLVSW